MVAIEAQISGLPVLVSDTCPDEVIICENAIKVSLKSSISHWCDLILKYKNNGIGRQFNRESAILLGYSIDENIKILETMYSFS
jgi:glycosyltransferase involved in cell wall biosynthesis